MKKKKVRIGFHQAFFTKMDDVVTLIYLDVTIKFFFLLLHLSLVGDFHHHHHHAPSDLIRSPFLSYLSRSLLADSVFSGPAVP
jgi:hypothetical protein